MFSAPLTPAVALAPAGGVVLAEAVGGFGSAFAILGGTAVLAGVVAVHASPSTSRAPSAPWAAHWSCPGTRRARGWAARVRAPGREVIEAALARRGEPVLGLRGGGEPPGGSRATRRQALRARAVSFAATPDVPAVTRYDEVGAVALLCADLGAAGARAPRRRRP